MTSRDHEAIARVLRDTDRGTYATVLVDADRERLAREFADVLSADNPRFKRGVFLRACGVGS
jgi:hypothetical protein